MRKVTKMFIHSAEGNAIGIGAIRCDLEMLEGKKCNTTEALGTKKFNLMVYRKKGT